MPTDAVYIVVTIPKREHEKELLKLRKSSRKIRYDDDNGNDEEQCLEDVLEESLTTLGVIEVSWISSKNDKYFQVYFCTDLYENDATLTYLQSKGIGVRAHSSVGYIPFGLFYCSEGFEEADELLAGESDHRVIGTSIPNTDFSGDGFHLGSKIDGFKKVRDEFLKSVTSRMTVAQVVQGVRSSAEMTFDFVMYAIFAGCIAAAGLLNNSPVDVAAAMMIEPVMATVIAITFGLVIHDRELTWIGIRSCFISLIICLIVGYVYGGIAFIWWREWDPPPTGWWPTPEMQVRGLWRTLWYGALQALAAGGAIAVTLLNDNQAALVGVAVASTFLPPFINTGLLWAYATHIQVRGTYHNNPIQYNHSGEIYYLPEAWLPMGEYKPVYYVDMRWEFMALSGVSMIYTFVNVVCMIAFGCLLLKAKEVVPLGKLEPHHRFFKEDIKVARDYNRRMTMAPTAVGPDGQVPEETLGNQILSEWANLTGLDTKALLSDKPEARVTQLQTLQDILDDVGADDTFVSVTRNAVGKPTEHALRRKTLASVFGQEAAEGRRASRKSSQRPLSSAQTFQPVYDVESNVTKGTRRYTVSAQKGPRRGSKWLPNLFTDNVPSPNLTIGSEGSANQAFTFDEVAVGTRGLKFEEATSVGNRRASVLLQQSLKETEHSPFSVWPASGRPKPSEVAGRQDLRRRSIANTALARRMSRAQPRLSTFSEAND